MRIMRVGDPHIRPVNIEETNKLFGYIKNIIVASRTSDRPIQRLEILGDLFHTHSIIRLEVLQFWNIWLEALSDIVETIVLVGNHDQTGDYNSDNHALKVFKRITNENLKIIDKPTQIGVFGYVPYIHGKSAFIDAVRQLASVGARTLICHCTFSGSRFDNGFYAPEGINPDDVPFETIISGHIHKEQIIANGKVDYPGTPKWDTTSDANESKGVWIYDHDTDGKVLSRLMVPTNNVCTPILSFTWNEGEEQPNIPENAKIHVELIGSSSWVTKQKANLKGRVSIKTKITDKKRSAQRKAGSSFEDFILNTYSTNMDRQHLISWAKELGIV